MTRIRVPVGEKQVPWFVFHVLLNVQRTVYASSAAMAIALTGWTPIDCCAQEARLFA